MHLKNGAPRRAPGMAAGPDGRFMRVVEKFFHHGDLPDFRELLRRTMRPGTRYLVLDLDGTFHRNKNLGVLLGFDLSARHAYGMEYLARVEKKRGASAFLWNRRDFRGRLRYVGEGARRWWALGLFYHLFVREGWKHGVFRRAACAFLGPDAMHRMLALPRVALLHQMAGVPCSEVVELARALWRRHAADQVVFPEDIAWARKNWPGARIIVSSASPGPALDVVRETFPMHDVLDTRVPVTGGSTDAPWCGHALIPFGAPRSIAPPEEVFQNAHFNKIAAIVDRYPDFLDPGVHTVGITDTKHGEDFSWTGYFKCAADLNSLDPFSPLIPGDSPTVEIHSARVGTLAEREAAAEAGGTEESAERPRTLSREEMETLLGGDLARAEACAARINALLAQAEPGLQKAAEERERALGKVREAVLAYNAGGKRERKAALATLLRLNKEICRLRRARAKTLRPVSVLSARAGIVMEKARARLEAALEQGLGALPETAPVMPEYETPRAGAPAGASASVCAAAS
jgi:hypothetical protein